MEAQNMDNPASVTTLDFCGEHGLLAVADQQGKVPPKIGFLTRRHLCESNVYMIVSKFSIACDERKSLFLFLKLLLKDGWPCRCMCAGSMLKHKRSNPTQLQAAPQLRASSDLCFGSP